MTIMRKYFDHLDKVINEVDVFEAKRDSIIAFMDVCPAICFMKEAETGKYLYVNKSATSLLGGNVVGSTDKDLFELEDAKRFIGHDLDVLVSRAPILLIETLTLNGKQHKFLLTKFIVENGERCIGGIALPLPDVVKLTKGSKKVAKNEPSNRS